MRMFTVVLASLVAGPLLVYSAAASSIERAADDSRAAVVDLTGRWQLNDELSDKPPQPGEANEPGAGVERSGGRRPGGKPPGGGGGFPGGGGRGRMGSGGGGGSRPNPEEFAKMRDAMRAVLDAPSEIIVTRNDDEVVFTAAATGDVTRILVTGKEMKTTAGGAEHEIKANYKEHALVVESRFGPVTVVDTWRVSADRKQLERVTKVEGLRRPGGGDGRTRRVYDRVS